jgi:DNA primase large subunit
MDIVLDRKELTKYPFLKESQQLASQHVESLEAFSPAVPETWRSNVQRNASSLR